jgi:hypothetical protein
MGKIYRVFLIIMFISFAWILGCLTGFVIGYGDKLAVEVAKYRHSKKNVKYNLNIPKPTIQRVVSKTNVRGK